MDFDEPIDRRGTDCTKWDLMERGFGVPAEDGLAMWIADMDFRAPDFLQDAVRGLIDRASYGYFVGLESYWDAIAWWMKTRHGWEVEPDWIFTTYGLGHGIATVMQALTEPGDHVAIFTPVYHEFAHKIGLASRTVTELPLAIEDGIYRMDFDRYAELMTGRERMLLFCSPHNPAGRVWSRAELAAVAEFCRRHDLLLVSDEVHQDLVFSGHRHVPMHVAVPEIEDRLIMATSASKTFNLAGTRTGCITIPDETLRRRFSAYFEGFDIKPNLFGVAMTRAAYSPEGAAWADRLVAYLEGNYRHFRTGIDAIPGLSCMPMQATYLSWVDFSGTGMERAKFSDRVYRQAHLVPSPGHKMGAGGENFLRFNLGTRRALIDEALARLRDAFADLQ